MSAATAWSTSSAIGSDFEALTSRAARATPSDARTMLAEALALVRGRPFADGYPWEDADLPHRMEAAIADAATVTAGLALDAGDANQAAWAAELGRTYRATDVTLSAHALTAAVRLGRLAEVWATIRAAYDDAGIAVPAELVALRDRLARPDDATAETGA